MPPWVVSAGSVRHRPFLGRSSSNPPRVPAARALAPRHRDRAIELRRRLLLAAERTQAAAPGFSRLSWVLLFLVAGALSFAGLAYALRELPVGTADAVWTGLGAAGTAVVGMVLLGESTQVLRIVCVLLIVVAVVGLQATSSH